MLRAACWIHKQLLSLLPESQGGLFPIAVGLFHKHHKVRAATVDLLKRIDAIEVRWLFTSCLQLCYHRAGICVCPTWQQGRAYISSLNYYLVMTYYRYIRQQEAGAAAVSRLSVCDICLVCVSCCVLSQHRLLCATRTCCLR